MSGQRIAFFGSSLVSSYWNGAATYYRGLLRALAERGHAITFYEPDAFERQQHRDMPDPDWARVVVYTAEGQEGVLAALAAARGADLVVKASGVGVFDELLERETLALQGPATRVVFWDVDAPATLERMAADPADPLRPLVPRYDLILTYGGGPRVVAAYRRLGARDCIPVYNALDPSTHHPVPPDPRFACDLAFLGNRLPDREERVKEFLCRPAAALADRTFLLGGSGWEAGSLPANVRPLGHVSTRDHNAFNCTPRAVLNVNDFPRFKWDQISPFLPADLSGWTVLDVGCNAGFYSFELARRGARVLGIDADPRYLRQAEWARRHLDAAGRVRFERRTVYELPRLPGRFDLVLFMGVLYHLRYPLLALEMVAEKVERRLIFQTLSLPGDEVLETPPDLPLKERRRLLQPGWPSMAFVEGKMAGDPTNWWVPNLACSEALLRSAGLRVTARPGDEMFCCEPVPGRPAAPYRESLPALACIDKVET